MLTTHGLFLDLTNGEVHHLMLVRNDQLMYWDNLTPQQAYLKQSQLLHSCKTLADRGLKMTAIPEELQQPLKTMDKLQVESGLLEQLDAMFPDTPSKDRLAASFEIISTWAHLHPITLPPPIQKSLLDGSSVL